MIGSSVVESQRDAALARAAVLGLPTTAAEDWRYVDVRPLAAAIAPAVAGTTPAPARGVLVADGRYLVDAGLDLATAQIATAEGARLQAETEAPACWSWTGETRYRRITGRQTLELEHHALDGASAWRLVLDLAPGAELDLVLVHRSRPGTRASVGMVATLGHGAHLRVSEVVPEPAGQLLLHVDARLERDADLTWASASRGGELLRWRGVVQLAATGAHADISAVDQVDGRLQAHRHLRVHHQVGPSTSTQLFKSVLDGHASASFDGLVGIAPGADGADAEQLSRTLLLSPTARGDTRPQLDVHADEVKAGHGATIGQLDADEMLYLRMRGLDPVGARDLLIDGFVREVIAKLPHPRARMLVEGSAP
jgi:Fe-S cluster assembly protein SufD